MTLEIDRIAQRIARSRETDGYKLWRTQKDLDTQLYQLASARQPIPFELARMRAIIAKARAFRNSAAYRPVEEIHEHRVWNLNGGFDPYDFIDRSLQSARWKTRGRQSGWCCHCPGMERGHPRSGVALERHDGKARQPGSA
jgi:hypothetical protein